MPMDLAVEKKNFPEFVEVDSATKKARCNLCAHVKWMNIDSIRRHFGSLKHKKALEEHGSLYQMERRERDEVQRSHRKAESDALLVDAVHLRGLFNVGIPVGIQPRPSGLVDEPTLTIHDESGLYSAAGTHFGPGDASFTDIKSRLDQQLQQLELCDLKKVAEALGIFTTDESAEDSGEEQNCDDDLADIIADMNLDFERDLRMADQTDSERWSPYPNKTTFIVDFIDSLPRLRISESLMKIILWAMRECGARDVPTFPALRKIQRGLRSQGGVPTRKFTSALGHVFYMNDIASICQNSLANPSTRPHMRFYPEDPGDGSMTEVWHGEKWRSSIPLEYLTPMYVHGEKHFYVNEFAQDATGDLWLPIRWIMRRGELCADAYRVTQNSDIEDQQYQVDDKATVNICASTLFKNFYDLVNETHAVICVDRLNESACKYLAHMPNTLRSLADGEPIYTIFIDKWNDDVSGNVSKSYNKHYNTCITIRNLPRRLLQQEFHVHFVGTSTYASPAEQTAAMSEMIHETQTNPAHGFDAETGGPCRFRISVNAGTSDNPMQSEECSHIGALGNYPCRKCKIGGSQEQKSQDEMYDSLFTASPGAPRHKEETLREINNQLKTACHGVAQHVEDMQRVSGVKDRLAQVTIDILVARHRKMKVESPRLSKDDITRKLRRWVDLNVGELINSALKIEGYDPHLDTPIELLHTILLGIVKYIWHMSHTSWKDKHKAVFALRLQASDVQGLSIPPIRANYIMNYANSLIGRQLKAIVQTGAFHVYDLVSPIQFSLWKAVGELSALLWFPEIKNLTQYGNDLELCVANVLDIFNVIEPHRILTKIKLHLLSHGKEDVRRFGPLIGMATEVLESFNSVFRACSILSNHHAPSRDIALQLAKLEGAKQRLTGGYWQDESRGQWVRCGTAVQQYVHKNPILHAHLGWSAPEDRTPGQAVSLPAKKACVVQWGDTLGPAAINCGIYAVDASARCSPLGGVIAASTDLCRIGSWICGNTKLAGSEAETIFGRIVELFEHLTDNPGPCRRMVVIERYFLHSDRHPTYGMPVLVRRNDEKTIVILSPEAVMFEFNAQHDCATGKCPASGRKKVREEREDTEIEIPFIEHTNDSHFLINTHSLHNPHLIREVLPRHLSSPIPFTFDRRGTHDTSAQQLRSEQSTRKAKAKQKRADKATQNLANVNDTEEIPLDSAPPRKRLRAASEASLEYEENFRLISDHNQARRGEDFLEQSWRAGVDLPDDGMMSE